MDRSRINSLRSAPLRILLAFTAFKDSIAAERLCDLVESHLLKHNPRLAITKFPISDGGDGFLNSVERIVRRTNAEWTRRQMRVRGPLGQEVAGEFGVMRRKGEDRIGVVEIAKISGLEIVPQSQRNVFHTTNHGVGEVINQLQSEGIAQVVLGLGGTSTIDGGLSILYALPCFRFLFDDHRSPSFLTGQDLDHITKIEKTKEYPQWTHMKITAACDVKNTLLGPNGAVYMFGPQKGLQTADFPHYESVMRSVATVASSIRGVPNLAGLPHTGAAGGVLVGLTGGFPLTSAVSGVEMISELGGLRNELLSADLVFTGEGRYDAQTHLGKAVHNIRTHRPDAIVICGQNQTQDSRSVFDLTSRFGLEMSLHHTEDAVKALIDELMGVSSRL